MQHGTAWRLSITAIHEAGGERWVQVSVTANSLQHDLVVQMADTARASDAFASIESWLGHPAPGTRIIYVS